MSETTTFQVGDRVLVAANADDVYFDGEVEGEVVEDDALYALPMYDRYREEGRVNVLATDPTLGEEITQYVRPEDLTLITSDN